MPAAAVIRGGRALFEMIGRKGHVDGFLSIHVWFFLRTRIKNTAYKKVNRVYFIFSFEKIKDTYVEEIQRSKDQNIVWIVMFIFWLTRN